MPASRSGAIARAHHGFDGGTFLDRLRALVAVPTESQIPDRLPDLRRYCEQAVPPLLDDMGFTHQVLDNPDPTAGPVLVSTRIEDPTRPTVLIYGHGDVVRDFLQREQARLDAIVQVRGGEDASAIKRRNSTMTPAIIPSG